MSELRLAGSASVNADPRGPRVLLVDNEPFPFYVEEGSISVDPASRPGDMARLTVTMFIDGPVHVWGAS